MQTLGARMQVRWDESAQARPRTLVLLTRFYPTLPTLFNWQVRNDWQPSQKVPVSTWYCTPKTTIHAAYDLGVRDAFGC